MTLRFATLAFLILSASTAALAAPATPEGAAKIEAAFQTYFGDAEGIVTVTPEGESYTVTLDAGPVFEASKATGASGTMTPVHLTLTDLGDNQWDVRQEEPLAMTLMLPDALSLDIRSESTSWSGTFDTALMAFTTSQGSLTGLTVSERITEPQGPVTNVTYKIDNLAMETTGQAASGGGVDGTLHYTATGISETVKVEGGTAGAPPMDFDLTAARYDVTTNTKGVRTEGLYGLLAWAVAHPSKEAAEADFEGLKAAVRTALPFWNALDGAGEMTDIRVETPFGSGGIASADFGVEMSGIVPDGHFRERIALKGLDLPTALMPAWVPPLVPQSLSIDVAVDRFDLAAPAAILLDEAKPGVPPSDEMNARLLSALLPEGKVTVTIAPDETVSPTYTLGYEGSLDAGPGRMPEGTVTVTASGLDATLEALNAAPEDVRSGAVPAIMMLRGIAKPAGVGGFTWQIDMSADGRILVNGLDVSALAGGMQ